MLTINLSRICGRYSPTRELSNIYSITGVEGMCEKLRPRHQFIEMTPFIDIMPKVGIEPTIP